jgi:acetyl esterase/lipase
MRASHTRLSALQFDGMGVWDATSNKTAWQAVLGKPCGQDGVSPYSAPARASDLSNLPPSFIDVGEAETFRDEEIAYATGILAAGGQCELHVWGGAYHGFHDIAPDTIVAQACRTTRAAWPELLLMPA